MNASILLLLPVRYSGAAWPPPRLLTACILSTIRLCCSTASRKCQYSRNGGLYRMRQSQSSTRKWDVEGQLLRLGPASAFEFESIRSELMQRDHSSAFSHYPHRSYRTFHLRPDDLRNRYLMPTLTTVREKQRAPLAVAKSHRFPFAMSRNSDSNASSHPCEQKRTSNHDQGEPLSPVSTLETSRFFFQNFNPRNRLRLRDSRIMGR